MKINKFLLLTSHFLLLTVCSFAQKLTLADCRQKALEHNKSLLSSKVRLEQARHDVKSYKANFLPSVNLMALDILSTAKGNVEIDPFQLPIKKLDMTTGSYVYDMITLPDGSQAPNSYLDFPGMKEEWKASNLFVGGITLMQPIYSGGKITAAYTMSKIGESMASENIRLTESQVILATDEAYTLALQAKQMGDVARSYKALIDELKKNVEASFRHGMSTRGDVMKVQVKLNEAELAVQRADNGHKLALMSLRHVMGLPLDSPVDFDFAEFSDSLDITAESTLSPAPQPKPQLSSRPESSILQSQTELALQAVKLARSEQLPSVVAGASYTYANGLELAGKRLIDDGAASAGIMVKVPIDIFGGAASRVRSAKAKHQMALLEQQDVNEKMQLELAQSITNLDESHTELRLCQAALRQAEENLRLAKQQYEVGLEPISDYLEAQALWQQSAANLVQARCQLLLAQTKYKKAAGLLAVEDM